MYKHMADSIKESNEKSFVSSSEKTVWSNKADGNHKHNDLYNSKSEIDNKLDEMYKTVEGTNILSESKSGFTKNLEVYGNSKQSIEKIKIIPVVKNGGIDLVTGNDKDGTFEVRTDFIAVNYNDIITYKNGIDYRNKHILYYDNGKKYIKHAGTNDIDVTVPMGVSFVRFSHGNSDYNDINISIKRTHLDDIQSVGKKRPGAELYEFDIVTCGRNLAKPCLLITKNEQYPDMVESYRFASKELYIIKPNCKYSFISKKSDKKYLIWLDENKQFISRQDPEGSKVISLEATSPSNAKYVQLYVYNNNVDYNTINRYTEMVDNEWSLFEVGSSTITSTEPYTESVHHVELPFPLMSSNMSVNHGSLRHRRDILYTKDGNLFIEKWNTCVELKPELCNWSTGTSTEHNTKHVETNLNKIFKPTGEYNFNEVMSVFSSKLIAGSYNDLFYNKSIIGVGMKNHEGTNTLLLRANLPAQLSDNDALKFFDNSLLYFSLGVPEVIELGPVESFNLQTFENIVNIYSKNTDVEPIIKCKVPTSLSSSLYTNINSLSVLRDELANIQNMSNTGNTDIFTDNGVTSIHNTNKGSYITDTVLEGNTMVNIALTTTNNITNTNATNIRTLPLKHATKYTIVITCLENTSSKEFYPFRLHYNNGNLYTCMGKHTINKGETKIFTITTSSNPGHVFSHTWVNWCPGFSSSTDNISTRFMILEGDYTNTDIQFFTGVKSSDKNIAITTKNENLVIDCNEKIIHSDNWNMRYPLVLKLNSSDKIVTKSTKVDAEYIDQIVKLKPNTNYITNMSVRRISNSIYDNKNYWKDKNVGGVAGNRQGKDLNVFNTGNSTLHLASVYGIEVNVEHTIPEYLFIKEVIDVEDSSYIVPEMYNKTIKLNEPLRGIPNGAKDTIEKINGKLCVVRRCGKLVFDGNENWNNDNVPENNAHTTYRMILWVESLKPNRSKMISDLFVHKTDYTVTANSTEGIFGSLNGSTLYIDILKTKISNSDIKTGFKEWLSSNKVTLIYELIDPVIEPLEDDEILLPTFDKCTTVSIESGGIPVTFRGKLTTRLADSLSIFIDKISKLEDHEKLLNRIKLRSAYESYKTNFGIDIQTNNQRSTNVVNLDLFKLYCINLLEGNGNYDRVTIENHIDFYTIIGVFDYDMADYLFNIIDEQHPPEIIYPEI